MLNVIKRVRTDSTAANRTLVYRQLVHREAKLGGQLFGPVAAGVRREFFCLDESTWVWHEEWRDKNGSVRAVMTRYDILPQGIRKAQDNQPYVFITASEARHLYMAIDLYNQFIDQELAAELA